MRSVLKNLTAFVFVFSSSFILYGQELEEPKTSFLKKIDLVLGGNMLMGTSSDLLLNNVVVGNLELDFNSLSSAQYVLDRSTRDVSFYTGIKLADRFILGLTYRDGHSDFNYSIDYSSPGSPLFWINAKDSKLRSYGIFMRYLIPISDRFDFALQPSLATIDLNSHHETGFGSMISSTETDEFISVNKVDLNAQVIFNVFKRFNILVSFGTMNYVHGDLSRTSISYSSGEATGPPTFLSDDISDFGISFTSSTILFGLEIVL